MRNNNGHSYKHTEFEFFAIPSYAWKSYYSSSNSAYIISFKVAEPSTIKCIVYENKRFSILFHQKQALKEKLATMHADIFPECSEVNFKCFTSGINNDSISFVAVSIASLVVRGGIVDILYFAQETPTVLRTHILYKIESFLQQTTEATTWLNF